MVFLGANAICALPGWASGLNSLKNHQRLGKR
jgi:hypothetical protein